MNPISTLYRPAQTPLSPRFSTRFGCTGEETAPPMPEPESSKPSDSENVDTSLPAKPAGRFSRLKALAIGSALASYAVSAGVGYYTGVNSHPSEAPSSDKNTGNTTKTASKKPVNPVYESKTPAAITRVLVAEDMPGKPGYLKVKLEKRYSLSKTPVETAKKQVAITLNGEINVAKLPGEWQQEWGTMDKKEMVGQLSQFIDRLFQEKLAKLIQDDQSLCHDKTALFYRFHSITHQGQYAPDGTSFEEDLMNYETPHGISLSPSTPKLINNAHP